MQVSDKLLAGSAAIAMMGATTACTTNPETGESARFTRRNRRRCRSGWRLSDRATLSADGETGQSASVGAGLGAIAGVAIGTYMDRQQRDLEAGHRRYGNQCDSRRRQFVSADAGLGGGI